MSDIEHDRRRQAKQWVWIAPLGVLGTVVIGIIAMQSFDRAPRTMFVQNVDAAGKPTGPPELAFIPAPEHIRVNGLEKLRRYVDKFIALTGSKSALMIFTPDGQRGLSVIQMSGRITLGMTMDTRNDKVREQIVRGYFAKRGIAPGEDYLAANGGVPGATRILDYPLPADAKVITEVIEQVLTEVFEVPEESPLDYTLQEY